MQAREGLYKSTGLALLEHKNLSEYDDGCTMFLIQGL